MRRRPSGLLSLGVLVVIVALCLMITTKIDELISLVTTFFGVWVIVLAGMRARAPIEELERYERGAFSTLAWGILLVSIGGAYFLNIRTGYWVYSLALVLLVIGVLVVTAALRSRRY